MFRRDLRLREQLEKVLVSKSDACEINSDIFEDKDVFRMLRGGTTERKTKNKRLRRKRQQQENLQKNQVPNFAITSEGSGEDTSLLEPTWCQEDAESNPAAETGFDCQEVQPIPHNPLKLTCRDCKFVYRVFLGTLKSLRLRGLIAACPFALSSKDGSKKLRSRNGTIKALYGGPFSMMTATNISQLLNHLFLPSIHRF